MEECKNASMQEGHYTTMQICKGVVSSYKIGLVLSSVAETSTQASAICNFLSVDMRKKQSQYVLEYPIHLHLQDIFEFNLQTPS